jgi:opacity protein-like surface antigen
MHKTRSRLPILFVALLPQAVMAAQDPGSFIALKTSIGDVTMDNVSHDNTIGTGLIIGNDVDGQLEETTLDDYTAGIGLTVGRHLGAWTVEGELVWRYRTDWDLVAPTPSIATITNIFSNVETTTLMFNFLRRQTIGKKWRLEAGAGIGIVHNSIEAQYIERASSISPELSFKDDTQETDFSYNVFVGLVRPINHSWSVNIRYRYIDLGELKAGPFPERQGLIKGDHTSNELQLSFERTF